MADQHLPQHVKDVPISALLDRDLPITTRMLCEVNSTTWGTHTSPPSAFGCSRMLSDVSSRGYLSYLAFTISGTIYSLALGVKKGPGEGEHGEEGGHEGQAGVRNYGEFLVLLYSTRKLSTATNQFLHLV